MSSVPLLHGSCYRRSLPARRRPADGAAAGRLPQRHVPVRAIGDDRGYMRHAGIHGLSLPSCRHDTNHFLRWHRACLYFIERALRDFVGGITHPFWDWTTTRSIPAAYSAEHGPDGQPNPLHHGTADPVALAQGQNINRPLNLPGADLPSARPARDRPADEAADRRHAHDQRLLYVQQRARELARHRARLGSAGTCARPGRRVDPVFWAPTRRSTASGAGGSFCTRHDYATTAVRVPVTPPAPVPGGGS